MKLRSLSLVLTLSGSALAACSDPAPATTATAADVKADAAVDAATGDTGAADGTAADTAAQDAVAGDASATDAMQADQSQADSGDGSAADNTGAADTANPADTAGQSDTATPGDTTGACPAPQPPGTICQGTVWVCAPGYFKPYGVTDCLEATCANMQAALNSAIAAVVTVSQSCGNGEECAVVPTSTSCQGTCGVAVAADRQNDVLKVVGWLDDNICKPFDYAQKCGYSTPKCMAPNPTCKAGVCAYMP